MSTAISIVILTYNAGKEFPAILSRLRDQQLGLPFEILVIDSGSHDGTVEWLRTRSDRVRLIEIPKGQFNHGLTRDLGVREANGEIVVFLTQDALPADEHWLRELVGCFDEPTIAGSFSRQLPRAGASPLLRIRLSKWTPDSGRQIQRLEVNDTERAHPGNAGALLARFDNVSSAVRREVAVAFPFGDHRFGEDMSWAYRVLMAGYGIVYEPRSRVIHSHDFSTWYEFKRAYLDHQNRRQLNRWNPAPCPRQLARAVLAEGKYYLKVVASDSGLGTAARIKWGLFALPFSATQNLGQYLGVQSVERLQKGSRIYRLIDRVLSRGV